MTNFDVATPAPVPASTDMTAQPPTAPAPTGWRQATPPEYALHLITVNSLFTQPSGDTAASCYTLGRAQMLPETAYQNMHSKRMFDATAHLPLATFVGACTSQHAERLHSESLHKNVMGKGEYLQTAESEGHCSRSLDLSGAREEARG